MKLPRILIIDDQLGLAHNGRNRHRENFCLAVGIRDITGDVDTETIETPVADAIFYRGQVEQDSFVRNDLGSTLEFIRDGWQEWPRWALLCLDLHFKTGRIEENGEPEGRADDDDPTQYFGLEILERLWSDNDFCDIPVIMLSSMKRDEVERRFADHGVYDFVDKSELTRQRMQELIWDYGFIEDDKIIGRSITLLKCLRKARQRAKIGDDNILLLGESGTGKELIARYIHEHSAKKNGPYITVYVQGVPETLIDDRLFGHEKGAFSDAISSVPGAVEEANSGTLFIDEFGDFPPSVQSKLLRLLDRNVRESQRIGEKEARKVDIQVILATNRLSLMSMDDFRKDLLYRVKIDEPILLPPLRERDEDIFLLAEYYTRKFEDDFRERLGTSRRIISREALARLSSYSWPGNIRELERVIENAVYRFPKLQILSARHLNINDTDIAEINKAFLEPIQEKGIIPKNLSINLLSMMREHAFNYSKPADWAGILPELNNAYAQCLANLLKAALEATKKPTPKNPEGEIKIHPAMKLLTGNNNLTASQAADIIKRMLKLDRHIQQHLIADSILNKAFETAKRLRPSSSKQKK